MNSENQNNETEERNGKNERSLSYYLNGKVLIEKSITKYLGLFLMMVFLTIIFISNRFSCRDQLIEMNKLKQELIYLENEKINLNSRLTKISRQMQIEESLHRHGVNLSAGNPNVYKINK